MAQPITRSERSSDLTFVLFVVTISCFRCLQLPNPCPADERSATTFQIKQTAAAIVVSRGSDPVLVYNIQSPPVPEGIDPVYRRSGFLHPVRSPRGLTVTETFPADHAHQHGIFAAWVNTSFDGRPIDFWNLAGGTGRVDHERVVSTFASDASTGFEVDLIHRATGTPPIDVLRERWRVTVYPTPAAYHCFDLETTQTAITDKPLVIHKYHYGGMALRGPTRWLTAGDGDVGAGADGPREPSAFLNDLRSDRIRGNHEHSKWVALTGAIHGQPVTVAVLCHRDNFRAPQAARLHPTKPYFCFAPCVDGEFQIDRDHPYRGRYRYLLTDAEPDASWLDEQWQAWCGE